MVTEEKSLLGTKVEEGSTLEEEPSLCIHFVDMETFTALCGAQPIEGRRRFFSFVPTPSAKTIIKVKDRDYLDTCRPCFRVFSMRVVLE